MISTIKKMSVLALALLGFGLAACSSDDGGSSSPSNYLALAVEDTAKADAAQALFLTPIAAPYISDALPALVVQPFATCSFLDTGNEGCAKKYNLVNQPNSGLSHAVIFNISDFTIDGVSICGSSTELAVADGTNTDAQVLTKNQGTTTGVPMFKDGLTCTGKTPVLVGYYEGTKKSCLFDGSDASCDPTGSEVGDTSDSTAIQADEITKLVAPITFIDTVSTTAATYAYTNLDIAFDDATGVFKSTNALQITGVFLRIGRSGALINILPNSDFAGIDQATLQTTYSSVAPYLERAFGDVLFEELEAVKGARSIDGYDICTQITDPEDKEKTAFYALVHMSNGVSFFSKPTDAITGHCASLASYKTPAPVYKLMTEEASKAAFVKPGIESQVSYCEVNTADNTCKTTYNLIASLITVEGTAFDAAKPSANLTEMNVALNHNNTGTTNRELVASRAIVLVDNANNAGDNTDNHTIVEKHTYASEAPAAANANAIIGAVSSHGLCSTGSISDIQSLHLLDFTIAINGDTIELTAPADFELNTVCGKSNLIQITEEGLPTPGLIQNGDTVKVKVNGASVDFVAAVS